LESQIPYNIFLYIKYEFIIFEIDLNRNKYKFLILFQMRKTPEQYAALEEVKEIFNKYKDNSK
jgi:hypothetical protein